VTNEEIEPPEPSAAVRFTRKGSPHRAVWTVISEELERGKYAFKAVRLVINEKTEPHVWMVIIDEEIEPPEPFY
jgi:hypothetical protein